MLAHPTVSLTDGSTEGYMDSDLVIRAQRGDQRAFEALATASHPRLQRVAVGILRDQYLAEDAVQQTLLNIWRDLRRLRDPARYDAWSYRLLVRACYAEAERSPFCQHEVRHPYSIYV